MGALKANGTLVIATATSVDEARLLASAGVDAIIAQGAKQADTVERLRHRPSTPRLAQWRSCRRLLMRISSGDCGRRYHGWPGIAAALMLGATGVQMGTAFVPCPETAANPAYVRKLLEASAGDAVLTNVISGRPARVLRNRLVDLLEQIQAIASRSRQLSMTRNLRKAASSSGNAEFLPMWAGQGVALTRAMPAAELVHSLVGDAQKLLSDNRARRILARLSERSFQNP